VNNLPEVAPDSAKPGYEPTVSSHRFDALNSEPVGPGVSVEASSIPSDPQRIKPDDQICCDGVVEPSTGDGWSI